LLLPLLRRFASHSAFLLYYFSSTPSQLTVFYTLSLHDALPILLIRHHDYDQCFQSVQLLQWNSQVKFNVTVYRNLPTTRTTERKIGRAVQQECRDRSRMPSSA